MDFLPPTVRDHVAGMVRFFLMPIGFKQLFTLIRIMALSPNHLYCIVLTFYGNAHVRK